MRSIGGPQAVRDMITSKGLGSIRFYEGERALQSKIAGLIWSQSYSIGDAFYKARGALPTSVRRLHSNAISPILMTGRHLIRLHCLLPG
jgi:beta-lactamase class A